MIGHAIADFLGISDVALILYIVLGMFAILLTMILLGVISAPSFMLSIWMKDIWLRRQSAPVKVANMESRFVAAICKQNTREIAQCVKQVEMFVAHAKREQDMLRYHT